VVARRLGREFGLRVYASDDMMPEHARRTTAADSPLLSAFAAMDMDERWVRRGPGVMLETFHWFRGEGFDLIVEDLERLPGGVVVEGFRLLPHLVAPLLSGPDRGVWLLPTPEFRRYAFERRGSLWRIAGRTGDPQTALANLLERDRLFTDRLRAETARLGLPTVTVDGTLTERALTDRVARLLGLRE
jgi:hypothetical protein